VDYSPEDVRNKMEAVIDRVSNYLTQSQDREGKVLQQVQSEHLAVKLDIESWIRRGNRSTQEITDFLDAYLDNSMHIHHPRYIGHQVAVPHAASGIADYIHGSINNPMAIYEMGPSAAVIEQAIINWMLEKVGWFKGKSITDFSHIPENGSGIMTHGGSMANLTALLAARAKVAPDAWNNGNSNDLVVLGSEVAHYSILRSISIMGLGKKALVPVGVDKNEVLRVDKLEETILRTREEGKKIMAVIANACATSTGLYDPIDEMGNLCQEYDLWFHVDGAHGASALLHNDIIHYMEGSARANSMIWDTHKMLRTSTLSAAVLFKSSAEMNATFQQKGSYLFHEKEQPGFDLMPYAIECTKGAIATKLFWVLGAMGEKGLGSYVNDRYQITTDIYKVIQEEEDFHCPYHPEANILCFKYTGGLDSNEYQLALRNEIVKRGYFYITSTEISNIRYLRLTVIHPHTTIDDIIVLLDEIRKCAMSL